MKSYATEAFVLRIRPLGEADRIIILFSRERGKIDAVARGARKPRNKFGGRLDFFTRVSLLLHAGRSLDTITSVHTVKAVWEKIVAPETFAAASYVAEVVDALCEPDMAVPELYQTLGEFQDAVAATVSLDLLLARTNLRILEALGFSPELDACARCGSVLGRRPLVAGRAWLSPHAGGLLCNACVRSLREAASERSDALSASAADLALLRRLRNLRLGAGHEGGAGEARSVEPAAAARLSRLTRAFIEYQMGRRSRAHGSSAVKLRARKR